jgi:hypothetical protein
VSHAPLTTRETYQVLRDIALGIRTLRRVSEQRWAQLHGGQMTVEAEGWVLTFCNDSGALDYCASCYAPDGRAYVFGSEQKFGTSPIELMSTWEHRQLGNLLAAL